MHEIISFMVLMKEVSIIFEIRLTKAEVFCKVYKDNQSYIAAMELKTNSQGTAHIDIKYHQFQSFVQNTLSRYITLIQENKQRNF